MNEDRLPLHQLAGTASRHRFAILLATLVLLLLLTPVVSHLIAQPKSFVGRIAIGLAFATVLISSVYAVSKHRLTATVAAFLAAPTLILEVVNVGLNDTITTVISHSFSILFLGFTVVVIFQYLFADQRVTANTICASLCVYRV